MEFVYEKLEPRHADEVYRFLCSDFLVEEPIKAMLKVTEEEASAAFKSRIQQSVEDAVSYVVRNTAGAVVAVRLASIVKRPNKQEGSTETCTMMTFKDLSPKFEEIRRFVMAFESQLWDLIPQDINKAVCWDILSVAKAYARRGIAQALVTHELDELRSQGCQAAYAGASAFQSQNLFAKNGYTPLYELRYDTWKSASGAPVFQTDGRTKKLCFISNGYNLEIINKG